MHGNVKHGHVLGNKRSPTYLSWAEMKARCLNKKHVKYPKYGARGIAICKTWLKFENFLADMGERPEGKTLDRIINTCGYRPDNCRWATVREQQANRSNSVHLTAKGQTRTVSEWVEILKVPRQYINGRVLRGMNMEEIISSIK